MKISFNICIKPMYEKFSIMKRIITMILSRLKWSRRRDTVRNMHKDTRPCLWQRCSFYPKCQLVVEVEVTSNILHWRATTSVENLNREKSRISAICMFIKQSIITTCEMFERSVHCWPIARTKVLDTRHAWLVVYYNLDSRI